MLRSADALYQVAVDVFIENVVNTGVESCLLESTLDAKLFYQMADEDLELLDDESEETKYCRQQPVSEKEQLETIRDNIIPAFCKSASRRASSWLQPSPEIHIPSTTTIPRGKIKPVL